MRTAGMVTGTPDWQLDLMYEGESAEMWEKANEQPKEPLDFIEPNNLLEAYSKLWTAKTCDFDNALRWISEAIENLKGTPEADRLASIYDAVSDLSYEVRKIYEKAHKKWEARG